MMDMLYSTCIGLGLCGLWLVNSGHRAELFLATKYGNTQRSTLNTLWQDKAFCSAYSGVRAPAAFVSPRTNNKLFRRGSASVGDS